MVDGEEGGELECGNYYGSMIANGAGYTSETESSIVMATAAFSKKEGCLQQQIAFQTKGLNY